MEAYQIEKGLVHKLILSIIGSILGVGAYMVVWGINDAAFKAKVMEYMIKVDVIEKELTVHVKIPCHDIACERLRNLKQSHE